MSSSHPNPGPTWRQPTVFAPRRAATCRCLHRELTASRDEDGDWTCCSCGRPVSPSATRLREVHSALRAVQLRAA